MCYFDHIACSGSAQAPVAERPIRAPACTANKERPAMAYAHTSKPFDLDICDPDFGQQMLVWALQVQCEMHELVLNTKETIAATKAMIAEVDRMLAPV
jgi:hypothetical protein